MFCVCSPFFPFFFVLYVFGVLRVFAQAFTGSWQIPVLRILTNGLASMALEVNQFCISICYLVIYFCVYSLTKRRKWQAKRLKRPSTRLTSSLEYLQWSLMSGKLTQSTHNPFVLDLTLAPFRLLFLRGPAEPKLGYFVLANACFRISFKVRNNCVRRCQKLKRQFSWCERWRCFSWTS